LKTQSGEISQDQDRPQKRLKQFIPPPPPPPSPADSPVSSGIFKEKIKQQSKLRPASLSLDTSSDAQPNEDELRASIRNLLKDEELIADQSEELTENYIHAFQKYVVFKGVVLLLVSAPFLFDS
jgi:hypothetical protein